MHQKQYLKNMQQKFHLKNYKDQKEDYLLNYVNMKQVMIYHKQLLIKFYILIEEYIDKKLHKILLI